MVKKATVLCWNMPEIGIITADNDEEEVKKIFCKICKEFYVDSEEGKAMLEKFTGNVKKVVQNWVSGSEIMKKNNATDHVNKANYHATAVRILCQRANEKVEIPLLTEAEKLASQDKTISSQGILTHVQQLNITDQDQLLKKFQLLNFTISQNLSFCMYNKLAMFEKDTHKVNLGSSFLSNNSAREMTLYLLNSLLHENVVKPLNKGRKLYFSLLYDGSSSDKINDEKELYIIKTYRNRVPHFDML